MMRNATSKRILLTAFFIGFILTSYSQKIIGYATSWSGSADNIPYSQLTHINYAFALPQSNGHLNPLANLPKLQSLIENAHLAGVKVLISVGGWEDGNGEPLDATFEIIGANPAYRANLINDITYLVNTYNLDGADIDWEYPDAGASANNFDSLMTHLYNAMHPDGKLLTAAVSGSSYGGDGINASIKKVTDWINIMGYDYGSYQHSTYSESIAGVEYYLTKGFPADQLALGVPFYGRDSWESYADLVGRGADPYQDIFSGVGYNGINTIRQKSNYVKNNGLAGIMIWELSQDLNNQYSLLSAIYSVFTATDVPDQPSVSDIKLYPNPSNGSISITSKYKISEISICNPQGSLIYKNTVKARETRVDMSGYSPGIYIIKVLSADKEFHFKILKIQP